MKQLFALTVRRRIYREERLINAENVGIFVDQTVPKPLEVGNVGISAQLNGNVGTFAAETAAVTVALRHIARAGIILVVVADTLHFGIVNTVAALITDADILSLTVGRDYQLTLADLNIILSGNATVTAVKFAAARSSAIRTDATVAGQRGRNIPAVVFKIGCISGIFQTSIV